MEPIEPPWQAIKEWIPEDEPGRPSLPYWSVIFDWFNRPRNPSNPDPDAGDQRPTWRPEEIPLGDGCTLVLEYT